MQGCCKNVKQPHTAQPYRHYDYVHLAISLDTSGKRERTKRLSSLAALKTMEQEVGKKRQGKLHEELRKLRKKRLELLLSLPFFVKELLPEALGSLF